MNQRSVSTLAPKVGIGVFYALLTGGFVIILHRKQRWCRSTRY